MNKYNEISDPVDRCNRDYFQGLTVTMGSINQILGFSFFTMLLAYFVLFFSNNASEYIQTLVKAANLLLIAKFVLALSFLTIFVFIFPTTRFLLYKYQRKVSIVIPFSVLTVVLSASTFICLIALIMKDNGGGFTKISFDNLIGMYTLITIFLLLASFIFGVIRLKQKLGNGYSDVDTETNYQYKRSPNLGGYFIFVGITSTIGVLTQSFQVVALVLINAFLLIYSGKYVPELVYLAYLRNTNNYYQEVFMEKPDTIKIIISLLTKFSTYTWIAFIVWILQLGRILLSPIDSKLVFYQMNRVELILYFGSFLWLLLVAPSWWVLKKIFRAVFKKKEN